MESAAAESATNISGFKRGKLDYEALLQHKSVTENFKMFQLEEELSQINLNNEDPGYNTPIQHRIFPLARQNLTGFVCNEEDKENDELYAFRISMSMQRAQEALGSRHMSLPFNVAAANKAKKKLMYNPKMPPPPKRFRNLRV